MLNKNCPGNESLTIALTHCLTVVNTGEQL